MKIKTLKEILNKCQNEECNIEIYYKDKEFKIKEINEFNIIHDIVIILTETEAEGKKC